MKPFFIRFDIEKLSWVVFKRRNQVKLTNVGWRMPPLSDAYDAEVRAKEMSAGVR